MITFCLSQSHRHVQQVFVLGVGSSTSPFHKLSFLYLGCLVMDWGSRLYLLRGIRGSTRRSTAHLSPFAEASQGIPASHCLASCCDLSDLYHWQTYTNAWLGGSLFWRSCWGAGGTKGWAALPPKGSHPIQDLAATWSFLDPGRRLPDAKGILSAPQRTGPIRALIGSTEGAPPVGPEVRDL